MGRQALMVFAFVGTVTLAFGAFLALRHDAFGAETEEFAQQFVAVLVAFGPFLAWLGFGEAWEQFRGWARTKLATTTGSLVLCFGLLGLGVVLIVASFTREQRVIACDPDDTAVWLGARQLPCGAPAWVSLDDRIRATRPGFRKREGPIREFVEKDEVAVRLMASPPWRCKVLRTGAGLDSHDWCDGKPMVATELQLDVEPGVKAVGTKLTVTPLSTGYVKLQSERCPARRPSCLSAGVDGGDDCVGAAADERAAFLEVDEICIGTDRRIPIAVSHCSYTSQGDAGLSFVVARSEGGDPEEVSCEN